MQKNKDSVLLNQSKCSTRLKDHSDEGPLPALCLGTEKLAIETRIVPPFGNLDRHGFAFVTFRIPTIVNIEKLKPKIG